MFRQTLFAGIPKHAGSIDSDLMHSTFNQPHSIAQITPGQFIVSDCKNDVLRLINIDQNIVQTVETSQLNRPKGIFKYQDNLYVCDQQNSSLKMLNGKTGDLELVSGQKPGFEDGKLQHARFDRLSAVAVSPVDGVIYIADQGNHCIRYIHNNHVGTLVGTPKPGYIDKIDELHGISMFNSPSSVCVLRTGNIIVCDTGNDALRHVHVGARLVTTIFAKQHQNQFMHHCTEFKFNPNYDTRSLEENDRYHIYASYFNKISNINDMGKYFRRPTACCQLSDGSLLVACAGGEMWHVNNRFDDAVLIKNVVFGQITCLLSTPNDIIYAVDYTYSCVYKFVYTPSNAPSSGKSVTGLTRTGAIGTTMRQQGLGSTFQQSQFKTTKSRINNLQNDYALELLKREQPNGGIAAHTQDIADLIDFNALIQLISGQAGQVDLNNLSVEQRAFLLNLFKSFKHPVRSNSETVLALQKLFVNYVLTSCIRFSKLGIMRGVAMMNNITFGIQITDDAEIEHFIVDSEGRFQGPLCDTISIKITVAVGSWVGGPFDNLSLILRDEGGIQVHEETRYKTVDAEYEGMRFENESLVTFNTQIEQQLHFGQLLQEGSDSGFVCTMLAELVERDNQNGVTRMWTPKQYKLSFRINTVVDSESAGQAQQYQPEDLVVFQYFGAM